MVDILLINPIIENQVLKDKVINVGLLSVASYIATQNISVKVVDLYIDSQTDIHKTIEQDQPLVIGFSCSSAQSFYTALRTAIEVKKYHKNLAVIFGGQHVSGLYASSLLPISNINIDCFIVGPGETAIVSALEKIKRGDVLDKILIGEELKENLALNYQLYPKWQRFIPCVEIGRGCVYSCNFCNSKSLRSLSKHFYKKADEIRCEIEQVIKLYGTNCDIFLFGPIFGENILETQKILRMLSEYSKEIHYSFNLRSDCNWDQFIEELKGISIRSVFFGMESGSTTILQNMRKTRKPQHYIQTSHETFRAFWENGIPFFTSYIFGYWGETEETISETLEFIENNKQYLKAIAANQYYIYPGSTDFNGVNELCSKYQAIVRLDPQLHIYTFDNLGDMSAERIRCLCTTLENEFNDPEYFSKVRAWRFF
jgi:radical SAM superfamily enzyme YgiQ (UPF0313 family)